MKLHVLFRLQLKQPPAGFRVLNLKQVEILGTVGNSHSAHPVRCDCYRVVIGSRAIEASIQFTVDTTILHKDGLCCTVCVRYAPEYVAMPQTNCPVKPISHVQRSARDRPIESSSLPGSDVHEFLLIPNQCGR